METNQPIRHNLGTEECACLDRVLERTGELIRLAEKCQDCGWDVSAALTALKEQMEIARNAKREFFPNRP